MAAIDIIKRTDRWTMEIPIIKEVSQSCNDHYTLAIMHAMLAIYILRASYITDLCSDS